MRAVLDELARRHAHMRVPKAFLAYVEEQARSGHALRRADSGEPMTDFLRRNGVDDETVARLLTPDSALRLRIDFRALLRLPAEDVQAYLLDHLGFVLDLQQVALDSEMPTGFNAHGRGHVRSVTASALTLLQQRDPLNVVERREREVVVGGLLHDLGNLISRKLHGLFGLYLATQLFENYDADAATLDSFLAAMEIVVFHEVEFASLQAAFRRLAPATLAIIVADKTDVSFGRVSAKSNVPEAMRDAHVLVNLLVSGSSVWRETNPAARFCWRVDFRAKFSEAHFDLFSSLLKQTGRVKYPKEWTELYEVASIEYLFLFQSTFLATYLSRLYAAMSAAFELFPSVDEFCLLVDDAERGISLSRTFGRATYKHQVATLGKLFNHEQWPDTYLHRALELEFSVDAGE